MELPVALTAVPALNDYRGWWDYKINSIRRHMYAQFPQLITAQPPHLPPTPLGSPVKNGDAMMIVVTPPASPASPASTVSVQSPVSSPFKSPVSLSPAVVPHTPPRVRRYLQQPSPPVHAVSKVDNNSPCIRALVARMPQLVGPIEWHLAELTRSILIRECGVRLCTAFDRASVVTRCLARHDLTDLERLFIGVYLAEEAGTIEPSALESIMRLNGTVAYTDRKTGVTTQVPVGFSDGGGGGVSIHQCLSEDEFA